MSPTRDPLVLRVRCAPKKAPCPRCGTPARRKRTLRRRVRTLAYRRVAWLEVSYGEYQARCGCCKSFRTGPDGVLPKAAYDNLVRQAVLDRLLQDGLNVERTRAALRRDFLLELSTGFVYDCLRWQVAQLDLAPHRQIVLRKFSGTLCVDELHLGAYTLLLATDPLSDLPVAFALVSANDQDHMRRFLRNLANWGFVPTVVVTDGSNLYPAVLAEVWPKARHQLCVFHVLKDINDCVFDALRPLRRQLAGRRKRKGRRGRLSKRQRRERERAGATKKEQAYFIWTHRHLVVKRPEDFSDTDRANFQQMLRALPGLWTLRYFVLQIYRLFEPELTSKEACRRRTALVKTAEFQANEHLARALAMLPLKKVRKMIAYVHSPAGQ